MTEEEAVSELDNKGDDSLTSSSIFLFTLNETNSKLSNH